MLQNAYLLAKIGADTVENEQHFAEILPKTGNYPTRRGVFTPLTLGSVVQVRLRQGGWEAVRLPRLFWSQQSNWIVLRFCLASGVRVDHVILLRRVQRFVHWANAGSTATELRDKNIILGSGAARGTTFFPIAFKQKY